MNRLSVRTGTRSHWPVALALALGFLGASLGGVLGATSAVAADDPTAGGMWYYTASDLATVHKQTTGAGINIAVLDSPINPGAPDLAGVGANLVVRPDSFCADDKGVVQPGTSTSENAGHGTEMVSMIVGTGAGAGGLTGTLGVAPGATVRHYAVMMDDNVPCIRNHVNGQVAGIDQAVADGARIISLSMSGNLNVEQNDAIARAERAGVIVVVASNNRGGTNLGWPASANGVVSVESSDVNQHLNEHAVTSPLLSVVAPGVDIRQIAWADARWDTYRFTSGSSQATAWTAGVLALEWSAHPGASANQVIQALLRNTTTGGGQLARTDSWGYGAVSVSAMLAADPATYPDVNPLLRKGSDAKPAYADIVGAATPSPTSTSAGSADGRRPATGTITATDALHLALVVCGVVALVVAGIVLAVVLARRRRRDPGTFPGPRTSVRSAHI